MIALFLSLLIVAPANSQSIVWEQTIGPFGGTVQGLVMDSNDRIWAGTTSGLYHSADLGQNWILLRNEFTQLSIEKLAINSKGDLFLRDRRFPFRGSLFRSSDDGQTWTELYTPLQNGIQSVSFNSADHLFLSGSVSPDSLATYRSTDNGESWVRLTDLIFRSFAFDSHSNIFAVTWSTAGGGGLGGDLYFSADNGDTWAQIDLDLVGSDGIWVVMISTEDHIFAGTKDQWIYRSTDHGVSWTQLTEGLSQQDFHMLFTHPDGDLFALAIGTILYRSTDNGESWTELKTFTSSVNFAVVASTGEILVGARSEGVLASSDKGATWIEKNNGMQNTSATLHVNLEGQVFANFRAHFNYLGIFRHDSAANTWSRVFPEFSRLRVILGKDIFAIRDGDYFRSGDAGATWTQVYWPPETPNDFALGPDGRILAATRRGVYRSTDKGENWHLLAGLRENSFGSLVINPEGQVFAGVTIGNSAGVFRSDDFGDSWVRTGYSAVSRPALYINPRGHLFATARASGLSAIIRSMNNGEDWSVVHYSESPIRLLRFNADDTIYAVEHAPSNQTGRYSGGIVVSHDNGATWIAMNDGLLFTDVRALTFDGGMHLFAGTDGGGVFRTVVPITSIDRASELLPSSFELEQNYPNPFNPATTIQYGLPQASRVNLRVYNLLGQQVKTLVDHEVKQAGYHAAIWDGRNGAGNIVASGVYLVRMQAGDFVRTRKMVWVQ